MRPRAGSRLPRMVMALLCLGGAASAQERTPIDDEAPPRAAPDEPPATPLPPALPSASPPPSIADAPPGEPPPAPPTVEPAPRPGPTSRFEPHLALGPSVRTLFGDPLAAATIEVGLGSSSGRFSWAIVTDLAIGATIFGVRFEHIDQGPYFEYRRERLRLGAGINAGFLALHRVSNDQAAWIVTAVAYPQISWDVAEIGRGQVVYLVARPALGIFLGKVTDFTFDAFAGVGLRL